MAPKKSAVLEQEPVNPFEVVQGYVSQLKAPEDKPAFEVCTAILKMKTIPNDIQHAMESEQLPRTVIQAVDSSFGERRLAMLVLLAKLVRTSGRMKEAICTDESALALWGILSGVASKISELKEAAATPSEEQEPLPEDMDPKQAKEKEKEREEAARAREERFKEGMAQLGPEGTPQGLAVMMQGVRSVLEGRTRTSSAVADRGDVSHLSCLLSHADPAVAVEACRLLRALGRTAVGARECLKADLGAPALEIAGSAEAPPGLRCAALELLCQLCASSGGQVVELVDAGAVPTLLAIAAGETAPESLRASAVQLLAALMARSVTAIDQLWKAGGFACLRALLPRVPGIEFHEAPPVEEPEAAPEPEPPATGKGKGAAKGKAAAGKQAPGGDGGKESDRQSVAASPVGGQRTPRVGPGQVAPPESPSRSSVVHQHVALTMSSVLRLPTLRQRVLREDQEAAEDGKRGGEGEGGPEGSGGEGTADDGIRRATVAETMFFLLSKGQSRSASPEPEETPPEAAPGSKETPGGKKGDKGGEPEVPEYPEFPDPLLPPFPISVQMAAAECLQTLVLDLRCAEGLLQHKGFKDLIDMLPDIKNELLGEKLLKVATVILSHVKPKVVEELGLSAAVMAMAKNFAGTRLMLLRNTLGRTTMALRPEYPTRPPPPSAPSSPSGAPDLPRHSVWDVLADMHLASGVAQHT